MTRLARRRARPAGARLRRQLSRAAGGARRRARARAASTIRHGVAVTSVGGTPAYAAVELRRRRRAAAARAPRRGRRRHRRGGRRHRARSGTTTGRSRSSRRSGARRRTTASPTSASRRTARSRCCPRAITTGSSGPRRRERAEALLALADAAFLARARAPFRRARRAASRASRERRTFPLALEFARPTVAHALRRARQCRADAASGRGTGIQPRPARRLRARAGDPRRAARRARRARAMLAAMRAARRTDRWAGIAFTHGLVAICSATTSRSLRWPRGLALTLLDARAAGEARVHARDAVRPALSAKRARASRRDRTIRAHCAVVACDEHATSTDARKSHCVAAQRRGTVIIRLLRCIFPLDLSFRDRAHRSSHSLPNNLVVAPMAGVTDRPFRQLCKRLRRGLRGVGDGGVESAAAGHGEIAPPHRSRGRGRRRSPCRSPAPIRRMMADAARYNVERGAQIIDINMGCPAKKVCNAAAGSALLANEPLVAAILDAVVARGRRAGDAQDPHRHRSRRTATRSPSRASPRTPASRALAVHGRTRACAFVGAGRVRHDPRGQGGGVDSGDRQRRHRDRRSRRGACSTHTGADARHDRPRGAGPAVDLPRDRALPRARRRTCRRRRSPRRARRSSRISPITTRSTARQPACASRASTSAGTRRTSPAATRSAARSTPRRRRGAQLAAVDRFFDALALARRAPRLSRGKRRRRRCARRLRSRTTSIASGRGGPGRVRKTLRINGSNEIGRIGREVARRILPPARRRAAARHLRHGDQARRARADRVGHGARRRQPDAGGRHARHEPQHAAHEALEVRDSVAHERDGPRRSSRRRPRSRRCPPRRPSAAVGVRQDRARRVRARPRAPRHHAAVHRRHREGARRRRPRRSPRSATTPAFRKCSTGA